MTERFDQGVAEAREISEKRRKLVLIFIEAIGRYPQQLTEPWALLRMMHRAQKAGFDVDMINDIPEYQNPFSDPEQFSIMKNSVNAFHRPAAPNRIDNMPATSEGLESRFNELWTMFWRKIKSARTYAFSMAMRRRSASKGDVTEALSHAAEKVCETILQGTDVVSEINELKNRLLTDKTKSISFLKTSVGNKLTGKIKSSVQEELGDSLEGDVIRFFFDAVSP